MALFKQFKHVWLGLGWSWRQVAESRRRRSSYKGRKTRGPFRPEQLEPRVMLSVVNLMGTAGNDTIIFQQTDATHDTFTLNGTPNTFSTTGVTSITIDSLGGTDSISVLSDNSGIPLSVMGSGTDTVTVGNSSSGVQQILGALTLSGAPGQMTLTADDTANSTVIVAATISSTEISGLAPATIDYTSGQLASITIKGGSAGSVVPPDSYDVTSTAPSTPVTINGGTNGIGGFNRSMVIGPDLNETWNLTGNGSGTVSNITFLNVQEVMGGSGDDTFNLTNHSFFGGIDGGGGNNTLVAPIGVGDNWTVLGANSGENNEATFGNIQNLTGGNTTTGSDTFTFGGGGSVSGLVDGAGGHATIIGNSANITISGVDSGTINGGTFDHVPVIQVANGNTLTFGAAGVVNSITGTGINNTIVGANQTNAWNITGASAGTINGINPFTGIQNFVGGTGNDTFTFANSASLTGSVNGGGGTDTLIAPNVANTWNITGANSGTLNGLSFSNIENLDGGTSNNTFTFGAAGSLSGSIIGGGGNDTLIGGAAANTWNITGTNSGTFDGATFSGIQNLTGGSVSDTFAFSPLGSVSGTVTGGGGSETLDYSSRSTGVAVNLQTNTAPSIGGGIAGINGLIGGTGSNSLTAANTTNTWHITGVNSGNITSAFTFSAIQTLIGGTGADTFVYLSGGSVSSPIDGGGGNNTLVGANLNNIWNITGSNSGTLNGSAFSNIQNLTGNATSDMFAFGPAGVLSGKVTGGHGTETLNYGGVSAAVSVTLQPGIAPATFDGTATAIDGGFTEITALIGGTGSNTLTGPNVPNTWNIYNPNGGQVDFFVFSGIQNLVGGTANDTFAFHSQGVESGTVNGGGGTNTLDYSARSAPVSVNLQMGIATCVGGGITNIENVIGTPGNDHIVAATSGSVISGDGGNDTLLGGLGNDTFILASNQGSGTYVNGSSGNNTLVGPNVANTWDITGPNAGTLNAATFANIQNLTGGAGNNTFAFSPSGSVSGVVNGSLATDTLDYSSRSVPVSVNLETSSATAIGGGFNNINSLIGGTGSNTLTGFNGTNGWNITGANSGTLNGTLTFSAFGNLTGGTANDKFAFGTGGSVSGLIRGGGGIDTLDYSALSAAIVVDLSNGIAADTGGVAAIQNVVGSTGNDTITAAAGGSMITATGSGNDTLIGGPGNDTFVLSATQGTGTTVDGRGGNNTLVGPNVANTWNITSGNAGTLNGAAFSNIQNLTGGVENDSFAFGPSGFVAGTVNGGGGGTDTLDYSSRSLPVVVNLQAKSATAIGGGFSNITSLVGGTGSDSLTGANTTNTWNITGTNSGTVNGTTFSQFGTLTGGTGNDTFAFATGGSVNGVLRGGGGTDTLDYSALSAALVIDLSNGIAPNTGGVAGIQNVIGSTGNDTITAAAGGSVITASGSGNDTLIGGPGNDTFILSATQGTGTTVDGRGGSNTLVGPNIANTWNITSGNAGTLNGAAFHNIQNLTGGTGNDTFALMPSGFVSGAVNGGGGTDTLDYSSRSVGVLVNLQTGSATAIGGGVTNVQNVIGSTGNDTIRAAISGSVITSNGGNDALYGGPGNNTFNLSNAGSSTRVDGLGGNNTVIGPNVTSTWNITGSNTGTVNGITFTNVENLTGGTGLNYFYMGVNGSLAGTLNGGNPTGNWLDYSAWYPQQSFVNLATGTATNLGAVMNIQNVRGSSFGGSLTGDSVGNILIGGQYSQTTIQGGTGRSLLMAGDPVGGDMFGGSGNDIIIGKSTSFDSSSLANDVALASILAEWQSSDSYATRIGFINGMPGGLNGTNYLIFGTTVFQSPGMTTMSGAPGGGNWYFAGEHDVINGLQPGERVN